MKDIIVVIILLAIIAAAIAYIIHAKKSGAKCIGCPSAGCCGAKGKTECDCGCTGSDTPDNE